MAPPSRWMSHALLAAMVGAAACMAAPAQAQDAATVRVRVAADDVVVRGGHAYWFNDRTDRYERLVVQRDRDRRPSYYRVVPRAWYYGAHGYSNGLHDYRPPVSRVKCTDAGNCTVQYYDPRYDPRAYGYPGAYRGEYRSGYRDGYRDGSRNRYRDGSDDGARGDQRDDGQRGGDGRRQGGRDDD